ncbi:MAG: hypothetical protein OIN86_13090 [Candidatus Methanoperedens sp.]|nr:hypothetical protein [Candidatus Methanoperedens sp.]CAG0948998.1 hypothetical protein METP1_00073 [Methanosarcinales archaeon]
MEEIKEEVKEEVKTMNLELKQTDRGVVFYYENSPVMIYKTPSSDRMLKDLKIFAKFNKGETEPDKELMKYNINRVYMAWVTNKGNKTVTKWI